MSKRVGPPRHTPLIVFLARNRPELDADLIAHAIGRLVHIENTLAGIKSRSNNAPQSAADVSRHLNVSQEAVDIAKDLGLRLVLTDRTEQIIELHSSFGQRFTLRGY